MKKRKCIKTGDVICFSADDLSGETIKVLGTYAYPSFEALVADFDARSMGFAKRKTSFMCGYNKGTKTITFAELEASGILSISNIASTGEPKRKRSRNAWPFSF
jgi:hypothetical protein